MIEMGQKKIVLPTYSNDYKVITKILLSELKLIFKRCLKRQIIQGFGAEPGAPPEQWSCRFSPGAGADPEHSSKALLIWNLNLKHSYRHPHKVIAILQ